jgi:glycosyltransferase involved in cell wall biosynthesis
MRHKPTILMPVDHYYPAFLSGGPVRTLLGIVELLGEEFDLKIITRNWDFTDPKPLSATNPDQWNRVGNADVFYLSASTCSRSTLRSLVRKTPHDLLYLNSFWSGLFSLNLLWGRRFNRIPVKPVLLAPRGEFSHHALNHKKLKKSLFLQLTSFLRLYNGFSWHGSSTNECEQIQGFLEKWTNTPLASTVHTAIDLRPRLSFKTQPRPEKQQGKLCLVYLARIHPIKQLDIALEVLRKVRGEVYFGIYGPIDPGEEWYWNKCQALIRALPQNIRVEYHGILNAWKVGEELHGYHAFFMPTRTENYGHSIAEALSAGCPVVISDQTPWQNLLKKGVGWDIPLTSHDSFTEAIQKLVNMPAHEYTKMSVACQDYAKDESNSAETLNAYRKMFYQAAKF